MVIPPGIRREPTAHNFCTERDFRNFSVTRPTVGPFPGAVKCLGRLFTLEVTWLVKRGKDSLNRVLLCKGTRNWTLDVDSFLHLRSLPSHLWGRKGSSETNGLVWSMGSRISWRVG